MSIYYGPLSNTVLKIEREHIANTEFYFKFGKSTTKSFLLSEKKYRYESIRFQWRISVGEFRNSQEGFKSTKIRPYCREMMGRASQNIANDLLDDYFLTDKLEIGKGTQFVIFQP